MSTPDPSAWQQLIRALASGWDMALAALAGAVALGYHQREISQHKHDISAVKDEMVRQTIDHERRIGEVEGRIEARRREDRDDQNRRFDEQSEMLRDISKKLDAFILSGRK